MAPSATTGTKASKPKRASAPSELGPSCFVAGIVAPREARSATVKQWLGRLAGGGLSWSDEQGLPGFRRDPGAERAGGRGSDRQDRPSRGFSRPGGWGWAMRRLWTQDRVGATGGRAERGSLHPMPGRLGAGEPLLNAKPARADQAGVAPGQM